MDEHFSRPECTLDEEPEGSPHVSEVAHIVVEKVTHVSLLYGGTAWNRTRDILLFKQALYQLSYSTFFLFLPLVF